MNWSIYKYTLSQFVLQALCVCVAFLPGGSPFEVVRFSHQVQQQGAYVGIPWVEARAYISAHTVCMRLHAVNFHVK